MKPFDSPARIVEFVNDSDDAGDVCLFSLLHKATPDQMTLAWMVKAVAPAAHALFSWEETWELHWRERDVRPRGGAKITSSQSWSADLTHKNHVTLRYDPRRRNYEFRDLKRGANANKLYIAQDATVPLRCADIGIGLAGRPTHFVRAQPNISLIFRPDVHYWIAFGTFTEGESIDAGTLRGRPAPLTFVPGAGRLIATIDHQYQWSIAATSTAVNLNVTKPIASRVVQ